jgi:hypothetical protein
MENQDFDVSEYVAQISLLLNLEIKDEYKNEVIANFDNIKSIAALVNNFPLATEIEPAQIFEP